jgi:hypothetical protein
MHLPFTLERENNVSLFDFFKNPNKNEFVKRLPTGSPEKFEKGKLAANELLEMLKGGAVSPDDSNHVVTKISAAAWLAGTSLYRAFDQKDNLPPGSMVTFPEKVSRIVNKEWETLMYLFLHYSPKGDTIPVGHYMMFAMSFLEKNKPQVEMLHVQKEFQDRYNGIMRKYGLDYFGGARAGIVLCSLLVHQHCITNQDIDPQIAIGVVATGTLESSRTVPPPLRATITQPRIMRTESMIARS